MKANRFRGLGQNTPTIDERQHWLDVLEPDREIDHILHGQRQYFGLGIYVESDPEFHEHTATTCKMHRGIEPSASSCSRQPESMRARRLRMAKVSLPPVPRFHFFPRKAKAAEPVGVRPTEASESLCDALGLQNESDRERVRRFLAKGRSND